MVVNDDAGGLMPRGVQSSIASRLAPTGVRCRPLITPCINSNSPTAVYLHQTPFYSGRRTAFFPAKSDPSCPTI
ncbi:hypothetical protein DKY63_00840 [Pseudomonas putida]|uniref:Uncharacterized protein n=1 Tax=Pseudomonas putida TaxID=303 RepID=A0A2Z4RBN3_PSEPU|nr:hypothetical protein DKY63_00840 [Pseudomonas putida]